MPSDINSRLYLKRWSLRQILFIVYFVQTAGYVWLEMTFIFFFLDAFVDFDVLELSLNWKVFGYNILLHFAFSGLRLFQLSLNEDNLLNFSISNLIQLGCFKIICIISKSQSLTKSTQETNIKIRTIYPILIMRNRVVKDGFSYQSEITNVLKWSEINVLLFSRRWLV